MKHRLQRIPVPFAQRLQGARMRLVPILVFLGVMVAIATLWKDYVAAPSMVGQAEPVLAHVSSYKPGVLTELAVGRFQKVKAGDIIGQVMVTDPKILSSSLAVIQSEIELLRVSMDPIAKQQRTAMDFNQLQLDWMRERTRLATARVSLQLAESEYQRMETLYNEKIVAQRLFDQSKAAKERWENEVGELTKLVEKADSNLRLLQLTNAPDLAQVSVDPIVAAINVQKNKLKLTEDELSPVLLKAPVDGIVSSILLRSGEAVTPGQPIISIATETPVRIVGYLRMPIYSEPKAGMRVEVRTRGTRHEVGHAKVVEVGAQMENIPVAMLGAARLTGSELGLPVDISLPPNLNIRPGDLVDLTFLQAKN
jgi:multidrug resistance efflux pump